MRGLELEGKARRLGQNRGLGLADVCRFGELRGDSWGLLWGVLFGSFLCGLYSTTSEGRRHGEGQVKIGLWFHLNVFLVKVLSRS